MTDSEKFFAYFALLIAYVLWAALLSGCSPSSPEPKRLPPWSIVCSDDGVYSFTDDCDTVFSPSKTREDAERRMEYWRSLVESGDLRVPKQRNWRACEEHK